MNEDCRITDNGEKMETTHMSSNSVCAVVGENVMWNDVQDTLSEKKKSFHYKNLILLFKKLLITLLFT